MFDSNLLLTTKKLFSTHYCTVTTSIRICVGMVLTGTMPSRQETISHPTSIQLAYVKFIFLHPQPHASRSEALTSHTQEEPEGNSECGMVRM